VEHQLKDFQKILKGGITMKKGLVVILSMVLMLIAWPLSVKAKEIKSLKELIKAYDSTSCKGCHKQIYEDWEKSLHAKPLLGPVGRTLATFQGYIKSRETELAKSKEVAPTMKQFLKPCIECHFPQLMDASNEVAEELAKVILEGNEEILSKLQITCLVCHNRNAIIRKFRDGAPKADTVYGPKHSGAHPHGTLTKSQKNEMMRDSAFCGQCHQGPNIQHYDEPMWCVSNLDSHQQFYVPMGGTESCQDCHMRNEGGHRFLPNYQDKALTSKRLAKWIDLNVNAFGYKFKPTGKDLIPMAVVNTEVVSRIGHRFPDGCPSPNRVTLDIKVTTLDGKEIFKDQKIYMPQHSLGYDEHTMVYAANRKLTLLRDTSLFPFVPKKETFEIKLPQGVNEVWVEVSLTFRQLPGIEEAEFPIHTVKKKVSLKR